METLKYWFWSFGLVVCLIKAFVFFACYCFASYEQGYESAGAFAGLVAFNWLVGNVCYDEINKIESRQRQL
jgi:hypothetical protein